VRNAIVWCGLPDPGETRVAVQEQADETARGLRQLIIALEMIDPDRIGKTAAEIVAVATDENSQPSLEVREMFRDAVEALISKPDGRRLGNRLRHLRKRVIDGKFIDLAGEDAKRVNRWAVFGAEQFHDQPQTHAPHAPHAPASTVLAAPSEDVGHVEDVIHLRPARELAGAGADEELF
jgi:hypothetical protein